MLQSLCQELRAALFCSVLVQHKPLRGCCTKCPPPGTSCLLQRGEAAGGRIRSAAILAPSAGGMGMLGAGGEGDVHKEGCPPALQWFGTTTALRGDFWKLKNNKNAIRTLPCKQ